jgi:DNA-binding IclR family transcriptional regulator
VSAPAVNGTAAVQSVDRALTILELLAADGHLGVTEIAALIDVHKSTASRLLATLEAHGLAEQLPDRGRYRLGVGVLRLAGATRSRMDLVQESRPVTAALAATVGETVNVVILSGRETLYLDQVSGTSALQIHNWVGKRNPIHATANGRVLLAHVSESESDAILDAIADGDGTLARLTERTLVTREAVRADLAQIREHGYAVVRDELEVGLTAVAAPVRGATGEVIASLSVSGPTFRIEDRLEPIAEQTRQAALAVSERMGWSG